MLKVFTVLINNTISMGMFPAIFKEGEMTLIEKEGKSNKDPMNYRPITLLEVPGKVIERIISDRLIKYVEENHKFNYMQFGFRNGHSTTTAWPTSMRR